MKVLKAPSTVWSYKHTCIGCEAELEVEKGDVKYHNYPGDYRDPSYETWTAKCPICDKEITVPLAKIPKAVQLEIKSGKLPSPGTTYVNRDTGPLNDR